MDHLKGCLTGAAQHLLDVGANLSEGPLWDEREDVLYWVDIEGRCLHRYDPAADRDEAFVMPSRIGMVCLGKDGRVIVALEKGIYTVRDAKTVELLYGDVERMLRRNRFNDGKCDAVGRLWAGTMNMDGERNRGALYRITPGGECVKMFDAVTVSNGIEWSPDNRYMYFIDSPSGFLWRFDFDLETGRIKHPVQLIDYRAEAGNFDGMTMDAEGCLWIAQWGGFQVSRWDPLSGKKMLSVKLPVPNASSCVFGGENLDKLYITTAVGKDETVKRDYPASGSLYVYEDGTRGLPARRFGI